MPLAPSSCLSPSPDVQDFPGLLVRDDDRPGCGLDPVAFGLCEDLRLLDLLGVRPPRPCRPQGVSDAVRQRADPQLQALPLDVQGVGVVDRLRSARGGVDLRVAFNFSTIPILCFHL